MTMDDAVVHLTDIVHNISRRYPESDREDIQQACWLRIFEAQQKGKTDTALLICAASHAAKDELRGLQSAGLTPVESKYPAPKRVQPSWADEGADDADGWLEPSYSPVPSSDDLFDHILAAAATDDERAVVAAGRSLKARHDADCDFRLGSVAAIARESGLPLRRAKAARSSLLARLS